MDVTPAPSTSSAAADKLVDLNISKIRPFLFSHTKELLDEALDSVKNVLMQTFRKNLESGGDLKYVNLHYKNFY
jgi:hypothetical protein